RITDVVLLDARDRPVSEIRTGEQVKLKFDYRLVGRFDGDITFVFNLYRHDDFYICGATTTMDKLPAVTARPSGSVTVVFPELQLLAGRYKWRVAINDASGIGIYTEAVPVCEFQIKDDFQSVGLLHLNREWVIETR
ncbi:MAG: Wzt carbohydrate-binding domain-containing protein, partial [Bdellovibrionales bacterium]|nr:Wzt carbohydrate-binding domain-containing protein [Bdellovibrionales bacterium]